MQGTLAPRPSRGRPPPRASQAPAGVLCCPGGELLGTCDYSNPMKEKWIFSSQSHYSHRSVSPWKHSIATCSRRLPCWTVQVWAFALDRPGTCPISGPAPRPRALLPLSFTSALAPATWVLCWNPAQAAHLTPPPLFHFLHARITTEHTVTFLFNLYWLEFV